MELEIDFDNPAQKTQMLERVRALSGKYRVDLVRRRPRRADRLNRFYWPCVVQPLADRLRGQGHDITDRQVHDLLRCKFLRESVIDRETSEIIGQKIRESSELTDDEFNAYLDRIGHWMAKTYGVELPQAHEYHVV